MVNSIRDVQEYLDRGANAIEADVTFNRDGKIRSVFHGHPCDCYRVCDERESFEKYLNTIRDMVNPNHESYRKELALLQLDLKLDIVPRYVKYRAGEEVAKHLISHLFYNNDKGDPGIYVLVSIGHTSDSDVVKGIRDTFTKANRETSLAKVGFDVGLNDDLNSIRRMWNKLNVKSNLWQGDGISNCIRPLKDDIRLKNAIRIRDSQNGFMEKVYDWTVDLTTNIRSSLRSGVDAILTNFPERVHSVLLEKEFRENYRLATRDDNPFTKVSIKAEKVRSRPADLDAYMSSFREIGVAVMGYVWDIYKLRLQRPGGLFPFFQGLFSRSTEDSSNRTFMRRISFGSLFRRN